MDSALSRSTDSSFGSTYTVPVATLSSVLSLIFANTVQRTIIILCLTRTRQHRALQLGGRAGKQSKDKLLSDHKAGAFHSHCHEDAESRRGPDCPSTQALGSLVFQMGSFTLAGNTDVISILTIL